MKLFKKILFVFVTILFVNGEKKILAMNQIKRGFNAAKSLIEKVKNVVSSKIGDITSAIKGGSHYNNYVFNQNNINNNNEIVCSICFENHGPSFIDLQAVPNCNKYFHEICIKAWKESGNAKALQCPSCTLPIDKGFISFSKKIKNRVCNYFKNNSLDVICIVLGLPLSYIEYFYHEEETIFNLSQIVLGIPCLIIASSKFTKMILDIVLL